MGQYHLTVNLDKQEFLDPHTLGTGLKLIEQISNPNPGLTAAMHVLLACSNCRGGGDFLPDPLIGRWAGDRIAVVGDYAENADIPGCDASEIYAQCRNSYRYYVAEWTAMQHVREDEVFSLSGDFGSSLWRCQAEAPLWNGGQSKAVAYNSRTGETRAFAANTHVMVAGMLDAEWTDLSWTVARLLEAELDGCFHGAGWRRWQSNQPEVAVTL